MGVDQSGQAGEISQVDKSWRLWRARGLIKSFYGRDSTGLHRDLLIQQGLV